MSTSQPSLLPSPLPLRAQPRPLPEHIVLGASTEVNEIPAGDQPQGDAQRSEVKWEKTLWRRQPFDDNYVPPNFLVELDRVPARPRPRFLPLFFAALPISLHLSIIALFLSTFYGLLEGLISPGEVGWTCVFAGLGGWMVWRIGWGVRERLRSDPDQIIPSPTPLRSLILPPLLLSLLSPVLGTLTSATTSDSIWPLAAGLGFVHLLLADFRTGEDTRLRRRREKARRLNADADASARARANEQVQVQVQEQAQARTKCGQDGQDANAKLGRKEKSERKVRERRGSVGIGAALHEVEEEKSLTSSLSLTSALSASVVLASRLPSTSHVFSLVLLAVLLFAGWPTIAKGVREAGKIFSLVLTVSTALLAISLFPSLPPIPASFQPSMTRRTLSISSPSTPTVIFLISLGLVNVVGPAMLIYAWRWKMRRGGGWDVAVVRVRKGR